LLTASHQAFNFALLGLAIAGTVAQQMHNNNYKKPLRNFGDSYYGNSTYSGYSYYYGTDDPWEYYQYTNNQSIYTLAISFPVLYFAQMIIFSFACAAVFNRAIAERNLHRPVYAVPGRNANGTNPVIISNEMISALQVAPEVQLQPPAYSSEGGSSHSPV
jgi:hypothetical protein